MISLLGENKLGTELEGFETDQEEKINALEPWKNELWVNRWMKAKPFLAKEKLEDYFILCVLRLRTICLQVLRK